MLQRFTTDFSVVSNEMIDNEYVLMRIKHPGQLPEIHAGQFVELKIPDTAHTFLRRPISIHDVNYVNNTIDLLIRIVGNGTYLLSKLDVNEIVNVVFPLGNGFSISKSGERPLLIGGGVGTAPMLYLARKLKEQGRKPEFLFGVRQSSGLLRISEFQKFGKVNITTEDGSAGTRGFVTDHAALKSEISNYTNFFVCGPTPMMKAVARIAVASNIDCEVSLENKMACGIGVCLCCVTDTKSGHKCVCSDGPVFNVKGLKW